MQLEFSFVRDEKPYRTRVYGRRCAAPLYDMTADNEGSLPKVHSMKKDICSVCGHEGTDGPCKHLYPSVPSFAQLKKWMLETIPQFLTPDGKLQDGNI